MGTSVILITHDLGVVAGMTDKIIVMYAGKVFEQAPTRELFATPANPYTKGLLKKRARPGTRTGQRAVSDSRPAAGCRASAAGLSLCPALRAGRGHLPQRVSAVCADQRGSSFAVPFCERGLCRIEDREISHRWTQINTDYSFLVFATWRLCVEINGRKRK